VVRKPPHKSASPQSGPAPGAPLSHRRRHSRRQGRNGEVGSHPGAEGLHYSGSARYGLNRRVGPPTRIVPDSRYSGAGPGFAPAQPCAHHSGNGHHHAGQNTALNAENARRESFFCFFALRRHNSPTCCKYVVYLCLRFSVSAPKNPRPRCALGPMPFKQGICRNGLSLPSRRGSEGTAWCGERSYRPPPSLADP
jgi:hypothetical protein